MKLCNPLCSVSWCYVQVECFVYARQFIDASRGFGPIFFACLQVGCANEMEVICTLCAQLYLLGFLQTSGQLS